MTRYWLLFVLAGSALVAAGCHRSTPPDAGGQGTAEPFEARTVNSEAGAGIEPGAPAERLPLPANQGRARRLLDARVIHAGQDVDEVVKLCRPYRVEPVGRYAFIEFGRVPSLSGLSLLAVDGKLVSAAEWNCTQSYTWFDTLSKDEKKAAWTAYDAALSRGR